MKKLIYSVFPILLSVIFIQGTAQAATASRPIQGLFTSVSGKVKVTSKSGGQTRMAQKDSTVVEGERIVTDKDSKATLQLFDGSQLDINSNTDLALTKMRKPSTRDKILQFKLFVGSLLSKVKKLASSKSSFEIEAGGVVCGVRGTQFRYSYNPTIHNVTVHVDEGTVYLNSNGHNYLFTAGQTGIFTNGLPGPNKPGQSSNPNPGNGKTWGSSSLADLNQQFVDGLAINPENNSTNPIVSNADNNLTNPSVGGSLHINVHVNVSPPETVP